MIDFIIGILVALQLLFAGPLPSPPPPEPPSITGTATWYDYNRGQAAAGSELRAFLGPDWRGQRVKVCTDTCITVTLTDWCGCPGKRIIDLHKADFQRLAPASRGVLPITILEP